MGALGIGRMAGRHLNVAVATLGIGSIAVCMWAPHAYAQSSLSNDAVIVAPPSVQAPTLASDAAPAVRQWRSDHAIYTLMTFDALPGWREERFDAVWDALRASCSTLRTRKSWQSVCERVNGPMPSPASTRAFFESTFVPLGVANADTRSEGMLTGYFEPLLEGRRTQEDGFDTPVLGVPEDLYTFDWSGVSPTLRRSVVNVKPSGSTLVLADAGAGDSYSLNLARHELDTRMRRLRLRLIDQSGARAAVPYNTRAEIAHLMAAGRLKVRALAWVRQPLAHYAMQIQGAGRIRFPDGQILRVHYAEQNGHPFRPVRVVSKLSAPTVRARSLNQVGSLAEDEFEVEPPDDHAAPESTATSRDADAGETRSRGLQRIPAAPRAVVKPSTNAVDAVVEQLLTTPGPAPRASSSMVRPQTSAVQVPTTPSAPHPAPARSTRTTVPFVATPMPPGSNATTKTVDIDGSRLDTDPSFVFFQTATNQSPRDGPPGAMGVPLTALRSVAVDPRVIPLGYPVYLSAPDIAEQNMQRLVMAQDTGGAIRGAVRADYFWGFGTRAGELARRTKTDTRMWVLVPRIESESLLRTGLRTRSLSGTSSMSSECLVADDEHCHDGR